MTSDDLPAVGSGHICAGFVVQTEFDDVWFHTAGASERCEKCRAVLVVGEGYPVAVPAVPGARVRGPFCVRCAVKLSMIKAVPLASS